MLRMILADEDIGYGKNGYYLAASGSVGWNEIYGAFAKALVKRNVVDDETVREAGDAELEKMGKALNVPSSLVSFLIGGRYLFSICLAPHVRVVRLLILCLDALSRRCMATRLAGKLSTPLSISWKQRTRKWSLSCRTWVKVGFGLGCNYQFDIIYEILNSNDYSTFNFNYTRYIF